MDMVIILRLLDPAVGQYVLAFQIRNTGIGIIGEYGIMVLTYIAFSDEKTGSRHKRQYDSCNKGGKKSHMYMKSAKHKILLYGTFIMVSYHNFLERASKNHNKK